MRKFPVLMVLLVFGVFGIALGSTAEVQSATAIAEEVPSAIPQASSPECWPLDVVVLIDESLSMSKPGGNDPQGYRFIAAKEILNLLISNRRAQCPEAVHRFGVIVFGDYVSPTVALAPVDILPEDNRDDWSTSIVGAIDEISEYRAQNGTDPLLAFQAADTLLTSAEDLPLPAGYGPRREVVILLTDGNPEGIRVGRVEDYMQKLSQSFDTSDWNKRSIWIVALNAKYLDNQAFGNLTMRQVWTDVATSHRGQLLGEDRYDEQTIPAALGAIIDEEFGQPGAKIQCGDFYVAPYLQSVRFVFSKRLEYQNKLVILRKLDDVTGETLYSYIDGQTDFVAATSQMTLLSDLYRRDGIIEEYTFDLPLPGRWYFEVEGLNLDACRLGVDARQTPRSANVRLIQPTGVVALSESSPYYDEEVPLPLVVRLEASDGRPIPLPDYPLTLKATLRLPSGKTQLPDGTPIPTYAFTLAEEDLWQSNPAYVLAPELGMHTLELDGVTSYGDPPEEYAVFTTTLSYEVRKLGRLRFEIQSPGVGESLPCNTVQGRKAIGRPIPVTVQLLDPTGQPGDADFYLESDLDQSFAATFLDAAGNPLDTIWLTPASRGVGILEGTLLGGIPNVIGCGAVSVQVTFEGAVDETRFVLPARSQTVSFSRPQSEGVLISITSPVQNARFQIYPGYVAAAREQEIQPVRLSFQLNALDNSLLDPAQVSTQPENLYQVRLVGPDSEMYEDLDLVLEGNTLSATGGLSITTPGDYAFEITTVSEAFNEGYIPADEQLIRISFERYQTFFTTPLIARILLGLAAIAICGLVALFLWHFVTRPVGRLVFETPKMRTILYEINLGRPLRGLWHRYVEDISPDKDATKPLKLSKVVVTKLKPDKGRGHRAVMLTLYDMGGDILEEDDLHSGEDILYLAGDKEVRVKYE